MAGVEFRHVNASQGIGFGFKRGSLMYDFGFAFRNGLWLHTMQGFNISFGLTYVGKDKSSDK